MNVPLIEMDPGDARGMLEEYTDGLRKRYDEEHEAVMLGLEALEAGERVLSLSATFENAEFTDEGLPQLAIARADRRWCRMELRRNSKVLMFDTRARLNVESDTLQHRFELPMTGGELLGDEVWEGWRSRFERWSIVPMIPPLGVRLAGGGSYLRDHFVLWEVDHWSDSKPSAIAPYDPYLLRPLGGDLYAVVHEWDLTELERAVMAGRATG